jgi:DNA repair protein RecN (Recombination protein N)
MLARLTVRDLALVDHCSLELRTGLTLLSGETGSGKSLLIDALGLALGARAQTGQVRQGASQALVEARFGGPGGTLSLRRTVGARGGAAIDGSTVPVAELAQRGRSRVAIHGQHDQQGLAEPEAQARLLDALAGALAERDQVAAAYGGWESARVRLAGLRQASARACEQQEFDLWRLRRLREVDPRQGEDDDLRVERNRLRNATRLLAAIAAAQEGLNADRGLSQAAVAVGGAADLDPGLQGLAGRLQALAEEAHDASAEIRRYGETLEADPARLEQVEARLALLDELKHRHGGTLEAVLAERDRLEAALGDPESPERELTRASEAEAEARRQLDRGAAALTRRRTRGARTFQERVETELRALGLRDAHLETRLVPRAEPGPDGAEGVELWFTANPGEPAAPLVFDEVDAVIGGRTALEVGRRLRRLARDRQVLVVTHLAQVAAFADHQLHVEKVRRGGRTLVRVRSLDTFEQRVEELARMMSGAVTEKALARAEELLQSARTDHAVAKKASDPGAAPALVA